ncbi:hypothetical protein L1987_89112 [Smallanthus sonchifolius]|nr:hypothetical protein L1987_89112 [Smallanthus sonchifolius]
MVLPLILYRNRIVSPWLKTAGGSSWSSADVALSDRTRSGCGWTIILGFVYRACTIVTRPKPFLGSLQRVQRIEYEGLPSICFNCGRFGHDKEECISCQGTYGLFRKWTPRLEKEMARVRVLTGALRLIRWVGIRVINGFRDEAASHSSWVMRPRNCACVTVPVVGNGHGVACAEDEAGSIESFSSAHVPTTTSAAILTSMEGYGGSPAAAPTPLPGFAAFLLIPKPLPALCRLAFAVQSVLASYLIPITSKLASFDVPSTRFLGPGRRGSSSWTRRGRDGCMASMKALTTFLLRYCEGKTLYWLRFSWVLSWLAFTHIIGLCSVRSLAFLRKILRTEMPKDGAQVRNAIF